MTEQEKIRLRLLREGNPQPDEFAEVEWLEAKGFVRAKFRYSRRRENAGEIENVVWIGITPDGREYKAELEAKQNGEGKNRDISPADENINAAMAGVVGKRFYQRAPWRELIIGVGATVIGGVALAFILRALGL